MINRDNLPKGRIPTRPLSLKNKNLAINKELIMDWDTGEYYIKKEDGTLLSLTDIIILILQKNTDIIKDIIITIPGDEGDDDMEMTLEEFIKKVNAKFDEIEAKLESVGSGSSKHIFSTTVKTEWSGETAPYTQTISIPGILDSDEPVVDIDVSEASLAESSNYQKVLNNIYKITTGNDKIIVYIAEKSTIEIPLKLLVVR